MSRQRDRALLIGFAIGLALGAAIYAALVYGPHPMSSEYATGYFIVWCFAWLFVMRDVFR